MSSYVSLQVLTSNGEFELTKHSIPEQIPKDHILINVKYSSINYKDALCISGKAKVMRHYPLTSGTDAIGIVVQSSYCELQEGDQVVITGQGLGETLNGGHSKILICHGSLAYKLKNLDLVQAALIGSAGFTAMLSYQEILNFHKDKLSIAITGASGGVASCAIAMMSSLGHEVTAYTRNLKNKDYLKSLGAAEVLDTKELLKSNRPMNSSKYHVVVDTIGGHALSSLLSMIYPQGTAITIGMALSDKLETSLMPFLIRGIRLLGITASNCPFDKRLKVWEQLDKENTWIDKVKFEMIALEEISEKCNEVLNGSHIGRFIVKMDHS